MEQQVHESEEVSTSLPAVPASQAVARRFVERTLVSWGLGHAAEDAVLIASELVANVLRHTAHQPVLRVRRQGSRIHLDVEDSSHVLPVRKEGGPNGGWGLTLVDQLSDRWGVRPHAGGKVIWCQLDTGRERSTHG